MLHVHPVLELADDGRARVVLDAVVLQIDLLQALVHLNRCCQRHDRVLTLQADEVACEVERYDPRIPDAPAAAALQLDLFPLHHKQVREVQRSVLPELVGGHVEAGQALVTLERIHEF